MSRRAPAFDSLIDRDRSVLLLIDYQARLMPAINKAAVAIANARLLANAAALHGIPVVVTEQNPDGLGTTVPELSDVGRKFAKTHFGAGAEPKFSSVLGERPDVVVAGCEAHVCVLQTVLGLLKAGKRVYLVRDGIGARTGKSKETALSRMERAGATVTTGEMVVFEWLRTSEDEAFRKTLALIKDRDRAIGQERAT